MLGSKTAIFWLHPVRHRHHLIWLGDEVRLVRLEGKHQTVAPRFLHSLANLYHPPYGGVAVLLRIASLAQGSNRGVGHGVGRHLAAVQQLHLRAGADGREDGLHQQAIIRQRRQWLLAQF